MQILVLILIGIIIGILALLWTMRLEKGNKQPASNDIINLFEPDNISPTLTDMINFHREKGSVDYEI